MAQCLLNIGHTDIMDTQCQIQVSHTEQEMKFWESINGNPNHIYDFAEEGWENFVK